MSFANAPYPSNVGMSSAQARVASASSLNSSLSRPANSGQTFTDFLNQTREYHKSREVIHEQERELFNQERALWQQERKDYQERIHKLEVMINSLAGSSDYPVNSPGGTPWHINMTSPLSNNQIPGPQATHTAIPTIRKDWEGPETHPTRTFSDSAVPQISGHVQQLSSIAEHPENVDWKKSVGFSDSGVSRSASLPAIPGEIIHPNLDGINLKATGLPSHLKAAVEEAVADGSPNDSLSPRSGNQAVPQANPRPKILDVPHINRNSETLYSADAGHTPLAKVIGSDGTTGSMTPVRPTTEVDRPPLEPKPTKSAVRQPSERSESYFNGVAVSNVDGTADAESDLDPALQGPLTVGDGGSSFLEQVNEKLERVVSGEQLGDLSPPASTTKGHNRGLSEVDDHKPLRMRKSANFGLPLGEAPS